MSGKRQRGEASERTEVVRQVAIDNIDSATFFKLNEDQRTRGHSLKLSKIWANSSMRRLSFSMRIVNDWNNLNESTISCTSLNSYKTALKNE